MAIPKLIPIVREEGYHTDKLFGRTFGLLKVDDNRVDYQPYGLAFFPPWNGLYDT